MTLADLHSRSLDPCGRRVPIHACTRRDTTCDMTGEDEPAGAIPRAAKPGPHRAVGVFIGWQRELDGRDLYFNRSGAHTVSCMHLELIRGCERTCSPVPLLSTTPQTLVLSHPPRRARDRCSSCPSLRTPGRAAGASIRKRRRRCGAVRCDWFAADRRRNTSQSPVAALG